MFGGQSLEQETKFVYFNREASVSSLPHFEKNIEKPIWVRLKAWHPKNLLVENNISLYVSLLQSSKILG